VIDLTLCDYTGFAGFVSVLRMIWEGAARLMRLSVCSRRYSGWQHREAVDDYTDAELQSIETSIYS
jgi:hypothetical protein